ncbi:MAG: DUF1295 domain-containing protein [Gammaproteobacteria bacterium]|jgi:steroid 5-alpha reductase family enzyme|nr:DUF1295 domain-containing protein [Gammaproteobacteria bacterium]
MNELVLGLAGALALMTALWATSIPLRDVSIIDLFWGPAIALCGVIYWFAVPEPPLRATLAVGLAVLWGARLGVYLALRNHGKSEDRRYVAMRERNDPGFWWKSLYLVFWLQGLLAWIVGLPLYGAVMSVDRVNAVDWLGAAIVVCGLVWESVADWQLARFLKQRSNSDAVMSAGLWRYSRHPNYFGEFCVWWGFWLIAAAGGAWWTIVGPLLISFFLLKVSGVTLLEEDIAERRPAYQDYVRRTPAFFPWFPRDAK